MGDEIEEYRQCVLDALGRMADMEGWMRVEAARAANETLELVHEHGEQCLREAQSAVGGIPRV